ncbi:hypothetical protein H4Q26_005308 [Puccinia striiformis f. sp. tritici PST-130]|nr:hypothetical protein H4Q26_005308 [Puccinia striiformis f. sp. tritici PST-130]
MAEIPDAPLAVSFIRPSIMNKEVCLQFLTGVPPSLDLTRLLNKCVLDEVVNEFKHDSTGSLCRGNGIAGISSIRLGLSPPTSPDISTRFLGPLLLQPLSLIDDPEYTLNLISELQSEIEAAIDEIESILARALPTKTEFEKVCLVHICQCFGEAYEQVQQFGLSSLEYKNEYDVTLYRENLGDPWALAEESMELAIKQLKETEFDLIQDRWKPKILMFGTLIGILNDGLIPSTEPDTLPVQFRRESVMQLVRSLLPIIKLSRLLMNSDQLDSLSKSAGDVNESFHQLLALFVELEENDLEAFHPRQFVKIIKTLKSRFEAALYLLLLYLIPAIPNTDSQDQLKTWFIVWNNGFILAIQNFENVVESLVVTP